MNIAYKYCDSHGIAILENLELKVTPPNQFNDPFEFTPHLIITNPHRRATDILKNNKHLAKLYQHWMVVGLFCGSFREFKKYVKTHRQEMAKEMSQHFQSATAELQPNILDNTSKRYGVLCLSNRRDSILMWGHYCDKHRGLVIGFDASNQVFQPKNGRDLRPVDYVRERVVFDTTWKESDPRMFAYEKKMVFSKNEDWRYEGELRQFFQLTSSLLREKPLDDGGLGYFQPIPPDAVVSVTLGAKSSAEFEKKVRLALAQTSLSHVKIDRAVLHDSEFALKFVDCV